MSDEQLGSGLCISISKSNPQGKQHELITWLVKGGDSERERWGVDWYLNLVFPALVMSREKIQRPHKDLGSFIKDLKGVFKRVTVELKWGDRWGTRNRSEFSGIGVCSLLWGYLWCGMISGAWWEHFYRADAEMLLLWHRGQSAAGRLAWSGWSQLRLWLPQPPAVSTGPPFSTTALWGRVERQRRLRRHEWACSVWSLIGLENSDEKAWKENPVLTAGGNVNQCSLCGDHGGF